MNLLWAVLGISAALALAAGVFWCCLAIGARKVSGERYGNGRNRELSEPREADLPPVE